MDWKKLLKTLIYPRPAIMIVLLPISTVLLVYSMVFIGTESVIAIISYVLAFYTLSVWCVRMPDIISFVKRFKNENKYAVRWFADEHLRISASLYGSLVFNTAYAALQLGLGFYHGSFWFFSMGGYYVCLALMRFFLSRYTSRNTAGKNMRAELVRYRACGWVFLMMNLALSVMVLMMVYVGRTFVHHQITTIAMAAYTFGSLTMAIIGLVKYRKYNSPIYSAAKTVSLAAACVSMLTLESTMLTAFGADTMDATSRSIMLGASGAVICVLIIGAAIYMIASGGAKIKKIKERI